MNLDFSNPSALDGDFQALLEVQKVIIKLLTNNVRLILKHEVQYFQEKCFVLHTGHVILFSLFTL